MKKTKFNLKKTSRASVSLMLSFLMLPVYTFAGAVTDGVKVSSARKMVSSAADLTVNSGLSDFDDVLRSVYGLFAVSSDEKELQKNLSEYFYRTVNNTAFSDEDCSGRRYIDSIASIFSEPSERSFDNLISLNTEEFSAEFTDGAVLADPCVLKSQILEYMKYTGPLMMSKGIINKLGAFRDFKTQNKAVQKKIEYDRSLEKINKICSEIWKNISAYNSLISENRLSGLNDTASAFENCRILYTDAVSRLLMYRYLKDAELKPDRCNDVYKSVSSYASESGITLLNAAASIISEYDDNGYILYLDELSAESDEFKFVKSLSQEADEIAYICNVTEIYREEYDKLSEEEKKKRSGELKIGENLCGLADTLINDAVRVREGWKNDADIMFREAADSLGAMCTVSDEAVEYLENILAYADDLIAASKETEKTGLDWKNAVSALADGAVKESMKSEYDRGVKGLEKNEIKAYCDIIQNNLDSLKKVRDSVLSVKFHDKRIFEYFSYSEAYLPLLTETETAIKSDALSGAERETANYLVFPETYTELINTGQGDDYPFYRYLQQIYGQTDISVPAGKGSAVSLINAVNSLGDMDSAVQDIPEGAKNDILEYISEDKLNRIKQYGQISDNEDEFEQDLSGDSAGSVLDGQHAFLESTGTFLESIGELGSAAAGEGIEDLLVAEYIMQMFSCYTSEKEISGGKTENNVQHMLSGVEMCSENNVFYRTEAEYILWGNENMEKNLQYTKSLIFGTRFALNSVYAFTDSEIRTVTLSAAAAIAGWTGFGVPVVKTVLVLSLALAESVHDMERLLEGEAVPVYKNSSSWVMKPSGIVNALVSDTESLAEAVAGKAGEKTEDIFKKISESAEGGADAVSETVNGYVDEFADECIVAAENTINNIIFAVALDILDNADETLSEEKVSEYIMEKIDEIEISGSGIQTAVMSEFKKLAAEKADDLASVMCSSLSSVSTKTREKINEAAAEVCEKTEAVISSLRDSVKESITEIINSVKENAAEGINEAGEKASEYAENLVGNLVTGAASSVSEELGGIMNCKPGEQVSSASALTLTYKEYLRIFLMLNSVSEEKQRAMLSRTAVLIDINMNSGMKKASVNGHLYVHGKDFDVSEAASMITAEAKVSVNTWLLGRMVPDFSDDNKGGFTDRKKIISVRTVLGY